jgi:hypothetical protein
MDYAKLYESLIETRRSKGIPEGYKEVHHIVPRSFGGSDDPENLVALTAREHFVAHRLLAKMYPNSGMVHAVYKMACSNLTMKRFKVTSRVYEHLRGAHAHRVSTDEVAKMKKSLAGKGKKQSEDHIKARTESRKQNGNAWLSDETKRNMSKPRTKVSSRTGRKFSTPEELAGITKMVEARKKNGSYDWTDERKIKQSERLKTNPVKKPPLTDAEKQRLREEKTKPVTCPHCGKVGAMMVMPRWHFDNCKEKG